eukprot:snap_masked-scaffold_9-processed-gene-10.28-mRNA-1 protein AED:1.00 eAED:1.00 QI:0/-1/0/0/-1/1/1/0/59
MKSKVNENSFNKNSITLNKRIDFVYRNVCGPNILADNISSLVSIGRTLFVFMNVLRKHL